MATLPVVVTPTYELSLPSNGKKITFRPFLVKEKKLLLLAKEAKEIKGIVSTIKQIITNCIVSPSDVEIDELPIIDLEMLFIHLHARSSGEVIKLEFECQNLVTRTTESGGLVTSISEKCGTVSKIEFNLLNSELEKVPGHSSTLPLSETFGLVMKYPTFGMAEILERDISDPTESIDLMVDSIDQVYDKENVYKAKDFTRAEMVAWFEGFDEKMFNQVKSFFETAPKVVGKTKFHCSKCQYEEEIRLEGIKDFFG